MVRSTYQPQPFRLSGRLDAGNSIEMQREIADYFTPVTPIAGAVWVLDLDAVDFIDSAGISMLIATLKQARRSQSSILLCKLQPAVRLVFEIAQLDRIFRICDDWNPSEWDSSNSETGKHVPHPLSVHPRTDREPQASPAAA